MRQQLRLLRHRGEQEPLLQVLQRPLPSRGACRFRQSRCRKDPPTRRGRRVVVPSSGDPRLRRSGGNSHLVRRFAVRFGAAVEPVRELQQEGWVDRVRVQVWDHLLQGASVPREARLFV